jgi:benzoate/toluate 1,2-dioxygenase subunit beta
MTGMVLQKEGDGAGRSTREQVEAFLYREARLADGHAYREWLDLWDTDALYWVPCNDDDADPARHVALIYENYAGLEDRVARLLSGYAHAQSPPSRLARLIGNIETRDLGEGLVEAHSAVSITAYRRGRLDQFAGRAVHRLRRHDDDLKLVRKTVYLVNNDGPISNLTFIV